MSDEPPKQRTLSVTEGCEPSDFAAWKKATRLSDVVAERLAKLPRNEEHEAEADFGEPGRYDRWRRLFVEQLLGAELIQGWHAIYASAPGEPPHEINEIAPEIMVGLTLDSTTNSAKDEEFELINVRLKLDVEPAARQGTREPPSPHSPLHPLPEFQDLGAPSAANEIRGPGRPSHGILIVEAIDLCARDGAWFSKPPADRMAAYREYMSERVSKDALQWGLDAKTLQKHETAFRKKHRR